MSRSSSDVMLLLLLLVACPVHSFRVGLWPHRTSSMRSRYAIAAMSGNATGTVGGLAGFFGTNRNTPEAIANQLEWAQTQMDLEMPESTVEGTSIEDKEDFIVKYIASEKEKFGRELTREEAALEVDEWLLKQATFAPAKTSVTDIALALSVFVVAFGAGTFLNSR
mmetsp:Transcript_25593/g.63497  ORF Transcript_25593/g.63497 Transcript_25593/m.63497 type:complete len:166 (-) Transcript_25593:366-863(-)